MSSMTTCKKQHLLFGFWILICLSGCSSTSQQQVDGDDMNASANSEEVNNFASNNREGSNYGNNDDADDGFDEFESNAQIAEKKNKPVDKELDDSSLINSAPLDLGTTDTEVAPVINHAAQNPVAQTNLPAHIPEHGTAPAQNLAVPTPSVEVTPAVAKEIVSEQGALWWIAYDFQRKDKSIKVQMLTKGRPAFDIFQEQNRLKQQEIIVRFYNTTLRPKMRRTIDATEFRSPVAFIRTKQDDSAQHVDVILTLREAVKPTLFAKRGNVQLSFAIPQKYFGTKNLMTNPEYVAQNLMPSASVIPDYQEGSDLPRTKELSKAYVPDPSKEAFNGPSETPSDLDKLELQAKPLPGGVDQHGLPVSDFVPNDSEDIAPAVEQPSNTTLPDQGAIESFSVLAVAQQLATPANQLDLVSDAALAPEPAVNAQSSGQVLSEESLPLAHEITGSDVDTSTGTYSGKPVVLEFFNAPLGQILKAFSDQIGTNFIYSPEIGKLTVSIKLRSVPWDAALDAILETYQLAMAKVSDNVIRIDRLQNMADYLKMKDQANQTKVLSEARKVVVIRLSNAKADAAFSATLAKFFTMNGVDNRTNVSVDPRTNTVFIEAPPFILARAKALIQKLDVSEPQVEVISRLIEVSRQARNFLGVSWNGGLNFDAGRGLSGGSLNFPNNVNSNFTVDPGVNRAQSPGAVNFNIGSINDAIDLGLRLKMEESKGSAEILQSNRVIVADREQASISAGSKSYYRVAQSAVFIQPTQQQGGGGGGAGDGGGGLTSASFNLSLQVTPEVTNDGHIRMKLDISSEVPSPQAIGGADVSTNQRKLVTVLKKRSGETAVIGGIYDTRKSENEIGIPFLSKLPIIGALFRSKSTSEDQTELMMLITPSIVGKDGDPIPDSVPMTSAPGNVSMNVGGNNYQYNNENNSNVDMDQQSSNPNFNIPEQGGEGL